MPHNLVVGCRYKAKISSHFAPKVASRSPHNWCWAVSQIPYRFFKQFRSGRDIQMIPQRRFLNESKHRSSTCDRIPAHTSANLPRLFFHLSCNQKSDYSNRMKRPNRLGTYQSLSLSLVSSLKLQRSVFGKLACSQLDVSLRRLCEDAFLITINNKRPPRMPIGCKSGPYARKWSSRLETRATWCALCDAPVGKMSCYRDTVVDSGRGLICYIQKSYPW